MPEPSSQPSGLRTRLRALAREVSKFGTVGGVAFAIDAVIFNVLLQVGSQHLVAKTIATVIAATFAFLGNRFWTWRHGRHTGMARQFAVFFTFNAIGLGIALFCLWLSHDVLGSHWPALQSKVADNIAGLLIGTGLASIFRFWSYRRFVFRATAAPATSASAPNGSVTSPSAAIRDSA